MDPSDLTLKISLGKISSKDGYFGMTLNIEGDGSGAMYLYLCEEGKRSGQIMSLSLDDYNELRRIIRKTDDLLKQLSAENKLKSIRP